MPTDMKFLSILGCAKHRTHVGIFLEYANGATRLTPDKCCGDWSHTVKRWLLTKEMAEEIMAEIERATVAENSAADLRVQFDALLMRLPKDTDAD